MYRGMIHAGRPRTCLDLSSQPGSQAGYDLTGNIASSYNQNTCYMCPVYDALHCQTNTAYHIGTPIGQRTVGMASRVKHLYTSTPLWQLVFSIFSPPGGGGGGGGGGSRRWIFWFYDLKAMPRISSEKVRVDCVVVVWFPYQYLATIMVRQNTFFTETASNFQLVWRESVNLLLNLSGHTYSDM